MVVLSVLCLGVVCVCCLDLMPAFISVVEWPPIGHEAAHSAYDMFS